ncbi:DUF1415 domain-containing protein [Motiliproteus sp. MSK22-1]|uniref:DUF1415 domain-containing protein n=1 Tax=Motiliproteus sp. MSK22-1 TaxID=1897630 RepID=UPI0009785331|nr:DUF1415 domain-containing protein [Motiliproteus sp. MSK22-1]OMH31707.1 hypothetical protein BGP75_16420 [Motiliproteus sp. MSK22-1]
MVIEQSVEQQVRQWLEQVVVGLNLCPFAAKPYRNQQIRFSTTEAADEEALLVDLQAELMLIDQADPEEIETTLLIVPRMLTDFSDYNQFLDYADALVTQSGWEGVFQIASFHPDYCFAGVESDNPENLTNRSPYPVLHIIREASLERALNHYADPEQIPERNIQSMRSLTAEQKRTLFPYLFS